MGDILTAEIKGKIAKEIEEYVKLSGLDKISAIEHLLKIGLKNSKIEIAIDKYKRGEISITRASEIAGVSLWEFMDELKKRNIPVNISLETVEELAGIK